MIGVAIGCDTRGRAGFTRPVDCARRVGEFPAASASVEGSDEFGTSGG